MTGPVGVAEEAVPETVFDAVAVIAVEVLVVVEFTDASLYI
jgi:hypothetical protein